MASTPCRWGEELHVSPLFSKYLHAYLHLFLQCILRPRDRLCHSRYRRYVRCRLVGYFMTGLAGLLVGLMSSGLNGWLTGFMACLLVGLDVELDWLLFS